MRTFMERALEKLPKMTYEQIKSLLLSLVEENRRLESVVDSLAEGLLVCDVDHSLILSNKTAERLLPVDTREGPERPIWELLNDDAIADFLRQTLQNGDRVMEREFDVRNKGSLLLLTLSVLPLVSDKRVTGSVIHVDDITEKRGKEARLRRAENLASLTTLAAGVAHEIKNPLGSISIHIQLIQKALVASCSSTAPIEKYLDVVNEEIDRLNHIVVDFLFAVRPMDVQPREGDINSLIQDLVSFLQYELDQNNIALDLQLDVAVPLLCFDERYIKQALLNLVKNALAAMDGGGRLGIHTEQKGDEVRVVINDTGIGIPEENLSKIFEPYFTTRDSGSGLGLTLVYKIVKEHGGEINVNSREGEGSSFILSFPVPQKERKLLPWEDRGL